MNWKLAETELKHEKRVALITFVKEATSQAMIVFVYSCFSCNAIGGLYGLFSLGTPHKVT